MGKEAICYGEGTAGSGEGRLLLESDELIFRGSARVRIPFVSITAIRARAGRLTVEYAGGTMRFDVGAEAPAWVERVQRPRSRLDKLGVVAGSLVSVMGVTDPGFMAELAGSGAIVSRGRVRQGSTVVLLGVDDVGDLGKLSQVRDRIDPSGGIWVVHRRGKTGVQDVEIFAAGKAIGMVANKVMRFSETHSADRLVIPKALRTGSTPKRR
jgi:hypothetical protein